ncbi:hypothetical protein ACQP2X_04730 [Actinoplanes sp. CA-131856]
MSIFYTLTREITARGRASPDYQGLRDHIARWNGAHHGLRHQDRAVTHRQNDQK